MQYASKEMLAREVHCQGIGVDATVRNIFCTVTEYNVDCRTNHVNGGLLFAIIDLFL